MVDVRLDKDVGKGGDAHLYGRGYADGADFPEQAAFELRVPGVDPVIRVAADEHADHQYGGEPLGHDGGHSRPGNAHAEKLYEQNVQHRVGQGRENEKIKGVGGVAHSPEDAGADVIEQKPRNAHKIDPEILHRLGEHVVRRVHQAQHVRCKQHAQHRQHHAHDQRQRHGGLDRSVELFPVLCPVVLGDHHARAAGKTHEYSDQGVDDGPCTAHSGKGLFAHIVAHNDGVHRIVKLLKDVADQQRKREIDQQPGDIPLGHICIPVPENGSQDQTLQFFSV